MSRPFGDFYRGKTVLVTGHTGFKGSWLTAWLTHLGAKVVGYALEPPTDPNNFTACGLEKRVAHTRGDIRDFGLLQKVFSEYRPDFVFHLAAQSLVRLSFSESRYTFEVNLMGTVNLLEAARRTESVLGVVAITSDKCYRNVEWAWGYRETDELGGHDPYSASKACAELAISSYQDARFQRSAVPQSDLAIASVRAGNVIGGGDWARDRIVPDTIRALVADRDIVVRNPGATRPWQHVLEPLSGYLSLGAKMAADRQYCSPWNFGPTDRRTLTVSEVVTSLLRKWSTSDTRLVVQNDGATAESLLLQLDCSKVQHYLQWHSTWEIEQALSAIIEWYKRFYTQDNSDMYRYSVQQIEEYTGCAERHRLSWARVG